MMCNRAGDKTGRWYFQESRESDDLQTPASLAYLHLWQTWLVGSRKNLQKLRNETKGWVRKKAVGEVINSWRQGREEGEAAAGGLKSKG